MNTENLQLNISNIEPTQVTQELRNISNRNNKLLNNNLGNNTNNVINNSLNNTNNLGINKDNSNLMIILKEMRQIFPLSVVIAFLIFLMLFIYIARF